MYQRKSDSFVRFRWHYGVGFCPTKDVQRRKQSQNTLTFRDQGAEKPRLRVFSQMVLGFINCRR